MLRIAKINRYLNLILTNPFFPERQVCFICIVIGVKSFHTILDTIQQKGFCSLILWRRNSQVESWSIRDQRLNYVAFWILAYYGLHDWVENGILGYRTSNKLLKSDNICFLTYWSNFHFFRFCAYTGCNPMGRLLKMWVR